MGKSTISMAMFNSYVKLSEGKSKTCDKGVNVWLGAMLICHIFSSKMVAQKYFRIPPKQKGTEA